MAKSNNIDKGNVKKKAQEDKASFQPKLSSFLDKKISDISTEDEKLNIYFYNGYAIVIKGSNISISVQEKTRDNI